MDGIISKQAAIEALLTAGHINLSDGQAYFLEKALNEIPSAEPEQKMGHWIENHEPFTWMGYTRWCCSCCGFECGYELEIKNRTNYCPNCGAKMSTTNNAHWIKQPNREYKCSACGDTTLVPLYECHTCGTKMVTE